MNHATGQSEWAFQASSPKTFQGRRSRRPLFCARKRGEDCFVPAPSLCYVAGVAQFSSRLTYVLIAMASTGASNAAASPGTDPPPIIVTAPSGSDTIVLADSPVNSQVLSGEALTGQHHANLADLLDASLGSVTLGNGTGNPYQNDVSYRGFAATSLPGSPTGLSVWLDGVRMNEPFGSIVNWDLIPMNALASVEVLPGSNPLFGLNTLGGALVLTTRNGANDGGVGATVQGGSFNRRALLGNAGGTLAHTSIDWFISGNLDNQDGYRWYTRSRVEQIFGKVRWRGLASNAELQVIQADTALNGTQGLPLASLATPKVAYTWPDSVANTQLIINLKVDTRLSAAVRVSGNLYYRQSDSHSINSNASLGADCATGALDCTALAPGGTARDLDAGYHGPLPIHDYTSGIQSTLIGSATAQHTFGGNVLIDIDTRVAGLANDLNLGGSFESSIIGYGQNTTLAYLVANQVVAMPSNFRYGSGTGFAGNPLIGAVAIQSRNAAINLFVRDLVKLTPHLGLTASLGYADTTISLSGTNTTLLGPGGSYQWTGADGASYYNPTYLGASFLDPASGMLATATVPPGALAGPEIQPVSGSHHYRRLNPAIGLAWNPQRHLGLFASYSQAMRAPTAIELACADPTTPCALPTGFNGDPALQAVVAHSLEAGFRGTFVRHITANAAVYRTTVANDIQFIFDAAGLGYFANLGRTRRQGFELGLAADWAALHLSASYGHVAATYRDSFVDANGDRATPGNRITGIPAQSFKLRANWQPVSNVRIGAGLIAVAGQFAHGDEANRNPAVPGYTLVNLDMHVTTLPRVELFATITNLLAERYATSGVLGTDVYSGTDTQFRTPAPGRTVQCGIMYRFGETHGSKD